MTEKEIQLSILCETINKTVLQGLLNQVLGQSNTSQHRSNSWFTLARLMHSNLITLYLNQSRELHKNQLRHTLFLIILFRVSTPIFPSFVWYFKKFPLLPTCILMSHVSGFHFLSCIHPFFFPFKPPASLSPSKFRLTIVMTLGFFSYFFQLYWYQIHLPLLSYDDNNITWLDNTHVMWPVRLRSGSQAFQDCQIQFQSGVERSEMERSASAEWKWSCRRCIFYSNKWLSRPWWWGDWGGARKWERGPVI